MPNTLRSTIVTGLVVLITGVRLAAAPLPLLVTAYAAGASSGNRGEALLVVRLANADGTPNTTAKLPGASRDPIGGLELKASNWSFATLIVPQGYGAQFVDRTTRRQFFLVGQLRILSIAPFSRDASGNADEGLYVLHVAPAGGSRGTSKLALPWVAGEYQFMVSYHDGADEGAAFGVLTVR